MTFEILTPPAKGAHRSVKMRARDFKHGVVLYLSIPREFIEGDVLIFDVSFGVDDDKGQLRLTPVKDGGFKGRLLKPGTCKGGTPGTVVLHLGEPPFAPDTDQESTPCRHEPRDGGLLITLPSWCFLDFGEAVIAI